MNDQPSRSSSCVESLKILFLHAQLLWPPPPFCCWWAHTNDSCLIGMQIPQTHKAKCEFVFWLRVTRHKHHERLITKQSVGTLTAGRRLSLSPTLIFVSVLPQNKRFSLNGRRYPKKFWTKGHAAQTTWVVSLWVYLRLVYTYSIQLDCCWWSYAKREGAL